MLTLENINYKIDNKEIIKNINYTFEEGKIYLLTGPNGGGKTSLGKVMVGLFPTDTGKITFNDVNITHTSISDRAKMGISYAFQIPINFKGLSVKDILSLSCNSDDPKILNALLAKVGLCGREYLDRELDGRLSGGEIKRIEIASVLAKKNTKLYIFDEPEAGIDLWSFKELISIFKKLKKENKTIIIVSHQEKILELSDYILVINKGTIEKSGPSKEILKTLVSNGKENNCKKNIRK